MHTVIRKAGAFRTFPRLGVAGGVATAGHPHRVGLATRPCPGWAWVRREGSLQVGSRALPGRRVLGFPGHLASPAAEVRILGALKWPGARGTLAFEEGLPSLESPELNPKAPFHPFLLPGYRLHCTGSELCPKPQFRLCYFDFGTASLGSSGFEERPSGVFACCWGRFIAWMSTLPLEMAFPLSDLC